jgi:hypothetical protein
MNAVKAKPNQKLAFATVTDVTDADLEGIVRCYCGAKYWQNLRCVSCGDKVTNELIMFQLGDD